jgi:hypothetical protein
MNEVVLTDDEYVKIIFIVKTLIEEENLRNHYFRDFMTIIEHLLATENPLVFQ